MRKVSSLLAAASLVLMLAYGCAKEVKEPTAESEISEAVLAKISNLGFDKTGVQRTEGGYLVEGDIVLTEDYLNQRPTSPNMIIAQEEQYHTFNLVKAPRTITVSVSGSVPSGFLPAVDEAIARYNKENLQLTFSRVASNGNIVISMVTGASYIASAGFPTNNGAPYNRISYNTTYAGSNYSQEFKATVIAHEIGHCIGFRHTDYMNRRYSCGSGGNEGQTKNGVGAVHIPGTPTGPDAASWMLACLSSTTNRPFNANDKIALDYIY